MDIVFLGGSGGGLRGEDALEDDSCWALVRAPNVSIVKMSGPAGVEQRKAAVIRRRSQPWFVLQHTAPVTGSAGNAGARRAVTASCRPPSAIGEIERFTLNIFHNSII